ncbi:MAG: hypothetical protein Q9217_005840 [Psora testacea]
MSIALGSLAGPICGGIIYHSFGYLAVFISAYALVGLDLTLRMLMLERQVDLLPKVGHDNTHFENEHNSEVQGYGTISQGERAISRASPSNFASRRSSLQTPTKSSDEDPLLSNEYSSFTAAKAPRSPFLELLATPRMLAAILGSFMESFILTELESTIPLYIKRIFHYNSKDIALVYLVLSIPSFGAPFVGAMSDRFGPKVMVSTGFVCLTPLLVLLRLVNQYSTGQVALLCTLLFAIGVALNLILTPVYSEAVYTVDEKEATHPGIFGPKGAYAQAFAQMNMAYATGSLVGPLVGGLLVERIGWHNLTLVTGICCALCVPICLYATGGRTLYVKDRVLKSEHRSTAT